MLRIETWRENKFTYRLIWIKNNFVGRSDAGNDIISKNINCINSSLSGFPFESNEISAKPAIPVYHVNKKYFL